MNKRWLRQVGSIVAAMLLMMSTIMGDITPVYAALYDDSVEEDNSLDETYSSIEDDDMLEAGTDENLIINDTTKDELSEDVKLIEEDEVTADGVISGTETVSENAPEVYIDDEDYEISPNGTYYGPNLSAPAYVNSNPYPYGQCTWYCYGRVKEKLGITMPTLWGDAKEWRYLAEQNGLKTGDTPAENSIMVMGMGSCNNYNHAGVYGHVAFVEYISGNYMRITDGNVIGADGYAGRDIPAYRAGQVASSSDYLSCPSCYAGYPVLGYIYFGTAPTPTPVPEPPKGSVMQTGCEQVVPNGYYQIVSMLDNNYALDIQGYDSFEDAPNAQLFRNRDVDQDVFELTYNGKFYTIRHVLSGKYLDVENSSPYNAANVIAYRNNGGGDNQQWAIFSVGDSVFQIKAKISGYSLDVFGAVAEDRKNICVHEWHGGDNQKWRLVPWSYSGQQITNGNYHIISRMYDQKYGLNVEGTSGNFRNVGAAQNLTNGSQVFTVEYNVNNNAYTIKQKGTKYWLEIENAGKTRNIGVATGDANGNPDGNWKRWYIKNAKTSGWYGIINRETGDSFYYNNRNGSNVLPTYGTLTYEDQWWKFVRAVDSVSLSKSSASTKIGTNITLTATVSPSSAANKNVTWSSSNTSVATVNSSGVVTPKAAGTTNITVKTADGGYTATCKVTVDKIPVTGVYINDSEGNCGGKYIYVGKTVTLNTVIYPTNATNKNVTWSSSNTNVATVSSTGIVTAKAEGTTTITAKTVDGGKTATFWVTVASKLEITTTKLSDGEVGTDYADKLQATLPATWSIVSGSLPDGLTLDSIGNISGKPSKFGIFTFAVKAKIQLNGIELSSTCQYTVGIDGDARIITESLPRGELGRPYSAFLKSEGTAITKFVLEGSGDNILPPGLTLDEKSGEIYGTPKIPGTFHVCFMLRKSNVHSKQGSNYLGAKSLVIVIAGEGDPNTIVSEGECGNNGKVKYKFTNDGVLTVYGSGDIDSIVEKMGYGLRSHVHTLKIEEGVTGTGSYRYYENLETVHIPSTCKEVSSVAFNHCSNLKNIYLQPGVEIIGNNSFSYCTSIESISLPQGLRIIGKDGNGTDPLLNGAFLDCSNLKYIIIPKSVVTIEDNAFVGCINLNDVYYEGTRNDWMTISIGANNECLKNANIHFNSEPEQPVSGNIYNVNFVSLGEVYKTIYVYEGKVVEKPVAPIRDNFKFDGWYIDKNCSKEFDFNTPITRDTTIYAKWVRENIVTGKNVTIVAGQKINLKETCFSNVDELISRYIVDNKKVASISKSMLSGTKAGTVKVTAQLLVGKNKYEDVATCNVIVLNKPKLKFGIPMTYEGQTIYASDYFTTSDTNTLGATFWESSKPDVVEVTDSTDGLLTAHKSGTAKITAYFGEKGKTGTLKVSATINVKKPAFQKSDYKLLTGGKTVLAMKNVVKAQNPEWVTEDENVAVAEKQLDKNGQPTGKVIVKALNCGDTVLTARIDGQEYKCTIHVGAPEISKTKLTIKVNKNATVSLKNTKLPKSSIEWYSENPGIAAVSPNGKVKGIEKGQTIIYTEAGGVRNECVVTVK